MLEKTYRDAQFLRCKCFKEIKQSYPDYPPTPHKKIILTSHRISVASSCFKLQTHFTPPQLLCNCHHISCFYCYMNFAWRQWSTPHMFNHCRILSARHT